MGLIASLYVSQSIPLGFFIVALPAILRSEGVGLEKVGLFGALAFPFLIKFLWAPWVDRHGSARYGHYRSWIVPLQAFSVLSVVAMSGLDIRTHLVPLAFAGGAFMLSAATQDIATDGLAVHLFRRDERGPANGIQVGGYYVGQVLGGGAMLLLFGQFGWTTAMLAMAAFLALPFVPLASFREPRHVRDDPEPVNMGSLLQFAKRPGAGTWISVVMLYRVGETMALMMVNPMLVDHGLSLQAIGLLLGLAGSIASFAGAMAGGLLIGRIGRKKSLVLFGGFNALAIAGYLIPASGFVSAPVIYGVATVAAFAGGMATAALYTNMMDRSAPDSAGTDFTVQQSLCAIGPLIGAGASGFLAARLGYSGHFVVCITFAVAAVIVVARWLTAGDGSHELTHTVADPG